MKKILIIYSEYTGHGHKSANEALVNAFNKIYGDNITCKSVNGFKLGSPHFRVTEKLYNSCVKYLPDIWGKFFLLSNTNPATLNKIISIDIERKFLKLIEKYQPDLILSVHPLFNGSILNILEKNKLNIKMYSLLTDLVSVTNIWLDNRADRIISPSNEATEFIIENNIDKDKIATFGIPVRDHFKSPFDNLEDIRKNTNINGKLRVLILNNTEKSKRIFYMIKKLHEKYDCDVTVVCGRNKNNYKKLKSRLKHYQREVNVIGYTKELFKLFYDNDILITRCGSLSIVEAINCIIPIISMGALPGQEEGTPMYLEKNGMGYSTSSTDDIFNKIDLLIANNREGLVKMREAQFNYYGRNVTDKIVKYIADDILGNEVKN
ncbi:glycosyltransferase [uncultured Brachyspira sp.]|uniref:MGDG synthase family glycosyltransferase n=1 Tax=uncultured Brachyspira sp. TaxID=221953 RepID=UPI002601CD00|nr:glycosyltransferase [uncultured Brachyspira sp.]